MVYENGYKNVLGLGTIWYWRSNIVQFWFSKSVFYVKIQPNLCPQHAVRAGSKIKHVPLHVSFFAPQARWKNRRTKWGGYFLTKFFMRIVRYLILFHLETNKDINLFCWCCRYFMYEMSKDFLLLQIFLIWGHPLKSKSFFFTFIKRTTDPEKWI